MTLNIPLLVICLVTLQCIMAVMQMTILMGPIHVLYMFSVNRYTVDEHYREFEIENEFPSLAPYNNENEHVQDIINI